MELILIAGLWLKSRVWNEVVTELAAAGVKATALELPGVDDDSDTATLEDQLQAALRAMSRAEQPVVLVGHSAACTLAWLAADRAPDRVARVVMIGGVPGREGGPYADFFEPVDGLMPFPGWEHFEGPDARDLDQSARANLESQMRPVPAGVSRATVEYSDERRLEVPVTLVCPEFSVEDAQAWLAAGDIPELTPVRDVTFVDIDSGHWPMTSKPAGLARLLTALPEFNAWSGTTSHLAGL